LELSYRYVVNLELELLRSIDLDPFKEVLEGIVFSTLPFEVVGYIK